MKTQRFPQIILALILFLSVGLAQASTLELRFLDVGQGDAILVRNQGRTALIDTGPSDDIGLRLEELGVDKIDILLITHNHADHLGGVPSILETIEVGLFVAHNERPNSLLEDDVHAAVMVGKINRLNPGEYTLPLGDANLQVLLPPKSTQNSSNENNRSIGVIVQRGDFQALLTGDSEVDEINAWLDTDMIPEVDILKAAHHGGLNGLTPLWIQRTNPDVVVISVGENNSFGHPDAMALRYYKTKNRSVFRTDQHGDVFFHVEANGDYVEGGEDYFYSPESETVYPPPEIECCRTCRAGKPCGDSCISANSTCTKPPGCACAG